MFKKLLTSLVLLFCMNFAFSTEFLGKNLENLNRYELTDLLKANGAKLKKVENLVDTFLLDGQKTPYATAAKAYYNYAGEFVGLKIYLVYDEQNLINLRKKLVEKYGSDYKVSDKNSNQLEEKLFFDDAKWNKKPVSIEYNYGPFQKDDLDLSSAPYSSGFLFFRHEARKNALIEQLKTQSMNNDNKKFKGVL